MTTPDLTAVIIWLENGCDPKEAAKELRLYQVRAAPTPEPQAADHVADAGKMVAQPAAQAVAPDPMARIGGSSYAATLLRNLLAVIHRDGGHYVEEHGIDKATEDAEAKVVQWVHAAAPVAQPQGLWSEGDAVALAHRAGFAGTCWSMSPEKLARLLNLATVAQPLTPQQITEMAAAAETPAWGDWYSDEDALMRFARGIERAHGVGASKVADHG